MEVEGRVAVVTGGGNGIGAALARALTDGGARVLIADLDAQGAAAVAEEIGGDHPGAALAVRADVADERELADLLRRAEHDFGPVDLFFANAGITGGVGLSDEADWERTLGINLMAHVRAARLLTPGWVERGEGYFVSTASAAGLLSQIGLAPYAVTKHAAVGFAEWLSITLGEKGVRVSCLCPMGVDTNMLNPELEAEGLAAVGQHVVTSAGEVLSPDQVAAEVLAAVAEERFLILPHPEVLEFYRHKGADYDRWLRGMRRLQVSAEGAAG